GSMSQGPAAIALGFKTVGESPKIAGVLLNNVGSEGHRRSVEDAIWDTAKLPVLGALGRIPALDIPQRQLGLLPVTENKEWDRMIDRKSTRLNSSHLVISYAVFCLKKKKISSVISYTS